MKQMVFGILLLLPWSISSVQFSRSAVSDSVTPWIAARQASLSITNSRSLLTHAHWVSDAIQPCHPLSSCSPPTPNRSQHQGLSQRVYDPSDTANLISGFSAFSKSSLYIWKFSVQILLNRSLKNFEHYLASMSNAHNCTVCKVSAIAVVWTFFGIAFLWDWS